MPQDPQVNAVHPPAPADAAPGPRNPAERAAGRRWHRLLPAAIVVIAVLAYGPAMRSGFIWDDGDYVTNNRLLRNWQGLADIYLKPRASPQYYPLTFTSFWIEYRFWGAAPAGYHVTNVVLHVLSALVLLRVLRRLDLPAAPLAAAIFALHPVCVESVAWVTERKNVLSGLLYLLAALAYFRFDPPQQEARQPRRWRWGWLATGLFAMALLSKTVTCTLPAGLMVVYWWKRRGLTWRQVWPLLPLMVLGAAMGLVTAALEKAHVGAAGAAWALSPLQRIVIAGRALWFYAAKLLYPHPLVFIYPRWGVEGLSGVYSLYPLAAVAVMVALVLLRRRIGKGPAAAVLLFTGTLAPALGFVNVYPMRFSFVADHFQYLASMGLIALLSSVLWRMGSLVARRSGGRLRAVPIAAAAVLVGGLAGLTWRQCLVYQDPQTLWEATLSGNPSCWLAHSHLGILAYGQGNRLAAEGRQRQSAQEYHRAVEHYLEALRLEPNDALVHYNYSLVLQATGQSEQAQAALEKSLALDPSSSAAHFAHTNLGNILLARGQVADAVAHYRQAVQISPDDPALRYSLGVGLLRANQPGPAAEEFRAACTLQPEFFDAQENLGVALEAAGQYDDAAAACERALKLDPLNRSVRQRLMLLRARQGSTERTSASAPQTRRGAGLSSGGPGRAQGRLNPPPPRLRGASSKGRNKAPRLPGVGGVLITEQGPQLPFLKRRDHEGKPQGQNPNDKQDERVVQHEPPAEDHDDHGHVLGVPNVTIRAHHHQMLHPAAGHLKGGPAGKLRDADIRRDQDVGGTAVPKEPQEHPKPRPQNQDPSDPDPPGQPQPKGQPEGTL